MKSNMNILILLIVGVVIAYSVYEYVRFMKLVEIGRELSNGASAFSRDEGSELKILVVGDSTAVGVGASSELSVPGRLSMALSADIENLSISGAKTVDVLRQLKSIQEDTRYDMVLIHAGANDVIRRTPLNQVRSDVQDLLKVAKLKSEKVVLLTSGDIGEAPIWPLPLRWFISHRTKEVREIIKSETKAQDALYVDIFSHDLKFKENPELYYALDFLHLSGDGYKKWFELVIQEIKETWPDEYGES